MKTEYTLNTYIHRMIYLDIYYGYNVNLLIITDEKKNIMGTHNDMILGFYHHLSI